MQNSEPTLQDIEDYEGKESSEKRLTVWVVILSGLLIAAIYGMISVNTTVSDELVTQEKTGIFKF